MDTLPLIAEHGLFQTMVILKPGESSARHHHKETHETYIVIEGEGKITVGGRVFPVQQGDFVNIPAMAPHQIINEGLFPMKVLSTKDKQVEDMVLY